MGNLEGGDEEKESLKISTIDIPIDTALNPIALETCMSRFGAKSLRPFNWQMPKKEDVLKAKDRGEANYPVRYWFS
ncbi:MAG: hypothetical protein ACD_28C00004G0010 [uncultured bacterium]|nr:MAG: hypothetical protein ACD_28C00004G0010 [uncultured bacterium]KKT76407.1 MAG: hypothetical protein UW70_C0018G0005 [Candidatus Peregrinibacteria bacterium GW2011_GWA2_44_7]